MKAHQRHRWTLARAQRKQPGQSVTQSRVRCPRLGVVNIFIWDAIAFKLRWRQLQEFRYVQHLSPFLFRSSRCSTPMMCPGSTFFKLLRDSGQELWSPKAGGVFQTKAPSLDCWLYLALVLMASMSKSVACSHPGSWKSGKHPGFWCRLLIAWRCQSVRTRRCNLTEMHGWILHF